MRGPVPIASRTAFAVLAGMMFAFGCQPTNLGVPPPDDGLFFPSGMLLDPRASDLDGPVRFLFVANGNNDLSYNGGTVVAIDLDEFFAAWTDDPAMLTVDPYCGEDRCVLNVGSSIDEGRNENDRPCRRLALRPSIVECDEAPFVKRAVNVGDFATLLTSSCEVPVEGGRCEHTRLWLPVRGDPSVTYIDLVPDDDEDVGFKFDCRNDDDPDAPADPDQKCGASHKLTQLRNNEDLPEIDREPFSMLISPSQRYGYVAHADSEILSVVALDGLLSLGEPTGPPAVVESVDLFDDASGLTGGFGLAERPCSVEQGNAPSITSGCTRPLVYGSYRYLMLLRSFTLEGIEEPADVGAGEEPKCLGPQEDLGQPGKIVCDPQVRSAQRIFPGGLDPLQTSLRPVLGDMAFGDDRGDELYVVQTSPGALLKLDTSLGPDGEPIDSPSAPPLELCEEPTRMKLWRDHGQRFAFISCFRAALVFVVDLDSFRVVRQIRMGTGPYELEVDDARDILYVSNTLERSISVIDISRDRPTRFQEIARIGLQDPFSQ